jgi:hypothetical protein
MTAASVSRGYEKTDVAGVFVQFWEKRLAKPRTLLEKGDSYASGRRKALSVYRQGTEGGKESQKCPENIGAQTLAQGGEEVKESISIS